MQKEVNKHPSLPADRPRSLSQKGTKETHTIQSLLLAMYFKIHCFLFMVLGKPCQYIINTGTGNFSLSK